MRIAIPFTSWVVTLSAVRRERKRFRWRFGLVAMLAAIALIGLGLGSGVSWYRAHERQWHAYYARMEGHWLAAVAIAEERGLPAEAARAKALADYNAERKQSYER